MCECACVFYSQVWIFSSTKHETLAIFRTPGSPSMLHNATQSFSYILPLKYQNPCYGSHISGVDAVALLEWAKGRKIYSNGSQDFCHRPSPPHYFYWNKYVPLYSHYITVVSVIKKFKKAVLFLRIICCTVLLIDDKYSSKCCNLIIFCINFNQRVEYGHAYRCHEWEGWGRWASATSAELNKGATKKTKLNALGQSVKLVVRHKYKFLCKFLAPTPPQKKKTLAASAYLYSQTNP